MSNFKYNYKVMAKNTIDEKEFYNIKNLISMCNKEDNAEVDFLNDKDDEEIIKFLIYNDKNLVAYFGVVCNSNFGKNYGWGAINPNYREKESYLEIFKLLKDECKDKNIKLLNLINERKAESFEKFLLSIGGKLVYSTYDMKFFKENFKINDLKHNNIVLERATLDDLKYIVPIGMEAFETEEEDEREYNESNLKDSKYYNFIAKLDDEPVGIISARLENWDASISDLGVAKTYRRRGFGRSILGQTIKFLINKEIKNFILTVETENKNALALYEDCGFRIVKINDCYEIEV